MTNLPQTVEEKIRLIIAEEFAIDEADITLNAHLEYDIGADSLDKVELVMRLEEEFEIDIADDEIDRIVTVGNVVNFVTAKAGKS